ncbi:MAG: hypothetical protein O7J95_10700 [Planctomycetota bacterium]|nr:hypothetical protein [Planctomycetota bacterium]
MSSEKDVAALDGYVCSSFGGNAAARLKIAEGEGCKANRKGGARKKLTKSDIIFFSGHHFARYDAPLEFDSIDLKEIKFHAPRVRLLMISSCAGLRRNAATRFRAKFPNAYVFGWLAGAPLTQKKMMSKFITGLDARVDIHTEAGMKDLVAKWRAYIESLVSSKGSVSPWGLGYFTPAGERSYYVTKNGTWQWVTNSIK